MVVCVTMYMYNVHVYVYVCRLATQLPDPELRRTLWVSLPSLHVCVSACLFVGTCIRIAQFVF